MACCAFAIMLLSQLLAPLRAIVGLLGLAREPRPDAAVLWAPGIGSLQAPPRRSSRWRLLLGVVALDLTLLALFRLTAAEDFIPRFAAPNSQTKQFERLIHQSICGQSSRRT